MIGRRFSHYRIVAELGSGAMGTVYRAEDTLLGRPVALKFPHRHRVGDDEARERFLREARAASVLDHPNIVVLYDVAEEKEEVFLAMQCVNGSPLRARIAQGPVPAPEAVAIARAVAEALAHAHGRGVIHRDVKPENILIGADGRVKVADFGTALLLDEARITADRDIVGTLAYSAPELLEGHGADERSDLYALGVVLHEMLSGTPPYHAEHAASLIYQVLHTEPAPLSASVDPALRRVVAALLAKRPDERPQDAVALVDALARLSSPGDEPPAPASAPPARTIAVLGFENLTHDPADDYFCAGISEDLATDLLKISGLSVASHGLVATLNGDRARILDEARRLGVATVLQGGVRRSGDRVRVTAQLVRTDTGYQMWAERYSRDISDLLDLQEEISRHIAEALRITFEPEDPESRLGRRARDPKAYDLRLAALAHYRRFEPEETRRAIGLFEDALRVDPDYALGRAELAESCVQMVCKGWDLAPEWLDRAEAEATRALELAPSLPEAHRALGHLWMHRREPERARPLFHRAVDLDPRFADGLLKLGGCYLFGGDHSRAEIYLRRAVDLDPLDGRTALDLSIALLRQRRFDECRIIAERIGWITTSPTLRVRALETILLAHLWAGRPREVREAADRVRSEFGDREPLPRALLALAAASEGLRDEALALLLDPAPDRITDWGVHVARARVHCVLGDREAAIAALERAHGLEFVDSDELRSDFHLEALAGDPRFDRIVDRTPAARSR